MVKDMYEVALKNKEKKEFDWDRNSSCLDFHLIIDGQDNYYYSGSYCYSDFEYYDEMNEDEELEKYSIDDFKIESKKAVKKFLNRTNKKEYKIDEIVETIHIVLWNDEKNEYDTLGLVLKLTYCP